MACYIATNRTSARQAETNDPMSEHLFNHLFQPTEWDWFCLQVQLDALHRRTPDHASFYTFDRPGQILCQIFGKETLHLLDVDASSQEQLRYYRAWIAEEKQRMQKILGNLPYMGAGFDLDLAARFQIMHPQQPALVLCEWSHLQITWPPRQT